MNAQAGEELLVLRKRKKLTLEEASQLIGIDVGTLSRYENGKVAISLEMIDKILKVYDEEPNNFFNNLCANMQKE